MQAQYCDPVIGRFYGSDPIGSCDIHSFNRYAYANNNPYKFNDRDDEFAFVALLPAIGGGASVTEVGIAVAGITCLLTGCGSDVGQALVEVFNDSYDPVGDISENVDQIGQK